MESDNINPRIELLFDITADHEKSIEFHSSTMAKLKKEMDDHWPIKAFADNQMENLLKEVKVLEGKIDHLHRVMEYMMNNRIKYP